MKRIILQIFFILLLTFTFTNKVFSQLPTLASQSWKCMRGDEKALTFNGASNTTISQDLYADGYTINGDAYIVTCVGTEFGGVCTTGNADYDKLIFGADNTKIFPYSVVITGGSKKQINLGKLNATATVTTQGLTGALAFYGVTIGEDDLLVGKGPAQKLGVAPFSDQVTTKCVSISWNTVFPPPPPPPPPPPGGGNEGGGGGGRRICPRCRWDPFGVVFDSQSLEPLPNVKVTILDNNKNKYYLPGLTNPQTTLADGLFNFLVEPGVYYLTITPPDNYKFTASPNLHPNYIKIYYKMDGSNSIYKPDEPVVEIIDTPEEVAAGKPDMEHRDIPLDPGTSAPYEAQPSTIAYQMTRQGVITKVDGKVSHPFTDVTFSQSGNLIVKVKTDRFGYYETKFNNSALEQDQDISVLYTKADLKTVDIIEVGSTLKIKKDSILSKFFSDLTSSFLSSLIKNTQAQASIKITSSNESLKLPPIFPYIEGYAYDKQNKALPLAVIRLKLKMNNASIYETKANNNGYFKVLPKYVPIFPYYLEILPKDGRVITYTLSEFAKKNKEYLANNKINLVNATRDNKSLISSGSASTSPDIANTNQQGAEASKNKSPDAEKKSKISSMLFLVFIIFIFFILIGLTIFFIIKNRKDLPPSSPRNF